MAQFSLKSLLGAVALAAIFLAGLTHPTRESKYFLVSLAIAIVGLFTLHAAVSRSSARSFSIGFALAGVALELGWHTMITTHIGSLKRYAFARDGVENAAMEFDDATLRPTYRLLMGVPGSSMALAVARRMGLDEDVLKAAEAEVARQDEPTRKVIEGMEKSRRRIERERQKVEMARRRADQ